MEKLTATPPATARTAPACTPRSSVMRDAAAMARVPLPASDMRASKLIDGVVWDGKDPKKYADGFKIKA